MDLRIIQTDGERVSGLRCLLRLFGYALSVAPFFPGVAVDRGGPQKAGFARQVGANAGDSSDSKKRRLIDEPCAPKRHRLRPAAAGWCDVLTGSTRPSASWRRSAGNWGRVVDFCCFFRLRQGVANGQVYHCRIPLPDYDIARLSLDLKEEPEVARAIERHLPLKPGPPNRPQFRRSLRPPGTPARHTMQASFPFALENGRRFCFTPIGNARSTRCRSA